MYVAGVCFYCDSLFVFDPAIVPSTFVNEKKEFDRAGVREPICPICFGCINIYRHENGLAVLKEGAGAYENINQIGLISIKGKTVREGRHYGEIPREIYQPPGSNSPKWTEFDSAASEKVSIPEDDQKPDQEK